MADSYPVALVHGLGSSTEHGWGAAGWIEFIAEAGREIITVDLPGHGQSRRSADPGDYPDAAAEISEAFIGRGPIDAIGFSAGASLLLECAVRDLVAFNRLVLMGVGPTLLTRNPEARAAFGASLTDTSDRTNVRARLFRGMADRAGNDIAAVAAFASRPQRVLTAAELAAVTCPVLVVTGSRDEAGSPEELAALMPNATGHTVDGVDHYALQANARAMDVVLSYLEV
jgi:pimeloyl-ACP methyl ester carboxylesterase